MICKDKKDWMQKVCVKFKNLTFQRTKHSIMAYSSGRLVAAYNLNDKQGMIL